MDVTAKSTDWGEASLTWNLGYAFGKENTTPVAHSILDIDNFDTLTFAGRAGATHLAAMQQREEFSLCVIAKNIPVNTNPSTSPFHALVIPEVGNIRLSRSVDGQTLYFLADDSAMAFGIYVTGIK